MSMHGRKDLLSCLQKFASKGEKHLIYGHWLLDIHPRNMYGIMTGHVFKQLVEAAILYAAELNEGDKPCKLYQRNIGSNNMNRLVLTIRTRYQRF